MKPHGDVVDALGDAFGFAVAEAVFDHGVAVGGGRLPGCGQSPMKPST